MFAGTAFIMVGRRTAAKGAYCDCLMANSHTFTCGYSAKETWALLQTARTSATFFSCLAYS